jgi:hypothetical protein
MPSNLATEPQIQYIATLLEQRQGTERFAEVNPRNLTRVAASVMIETMKTYPWKSRPTAVKAAPTQSVSAKLAALIPSSKYAIPFEDLAGVVPGVREYTGHLFLEVKSYKGVTYMRRLHGSLGDFTRSKLTTALMLDLITYMEGRTLQYAQEFGKVYTCCGSCGSPLTDEESRALHLGPECRKKFGL